MKKICLIAIFSCALGYCLGIRFPILSIEKKVENIDHLIIKQAILNSNTVIPSRKNKCEFDNTTVNKKMQKFLVADYFSQLLIFSMKQKSPNRLIISSCDNSNNFCYISFGDGRSNRFLRFYYNSKTKLINKDSFECIDVP